MKFNTLFYRKNLYILFPFLLLILLPVISSAQVQIDSIRTTVSTCPNNGTIVVYAKGSPTLFYSIISGTVTEPVQTNNLFSSLPSGGYVINVSDGVNSVTQSTFITGSYTQLDLNPLTTSPYCIGSSDGQIIGNRINNTGNGPFTWQLVSPSPITSLVQASDTFRNLIAGNYTLKVTDGCGAFRNIVVTLSDPANANLSFTTPPQIDMVGCDSAILSIPMHTNLLRFPVTCKFETATGTIITTTPTAIDSSNTTAGYYTIYQLLKNFKYSDYIKITITDACGNTTSSPLYTARPFTFCASPAHYFSNCTYYSPISFDINNASCASETTLVTRAKEPFTYLFTDASTNATVASGTIQGDSIGYHLGYTSGSEVLIQSLPVNKTYNITIKDACGNIFTEAYTPPIESTPKPSISEIDLYRDGCLDSVGFAQVVTQYFKSEPVLILLSGPSTMESTKPRYAYHDTYTYPDTIHVGNGQYGSIQYLFFISNLSVGKYQFKIVDSCGNEIFDSLVITDVMNLNHKFSYKKGCLGLNNIYYSANTGNGVMRIQNMGNATTWYKPYQSQDLTKTINDSILNVPTGTYEMSFSYNLYSGSQTRANDSVVSCQVITDTIVIAGYQTPEIATGNSVICHNTITVELLADSSKGVPPYQYEIISGPQTFPTQNSNIFSVTQGGTYNARIFDVCGNGSTSQITINNIVFPPISTLPNCGSTKLFYPSSAYYTYNWTKPDGTIYIGDTLNLNPITPADTGIYNIKKVVHINGCADSFFTTYHLSLPLFSRKDTTICPHDSVSFGTHTYKVTGVYTDTLKNNKGCDSLSQLNLIVSGYKQTVVFDSVCAGNTYSFGGHALTQPGAYFDTLSTATCDSIVILILKVNTNCPPVALCGGATHTVWKDDFGNGIPINGGISPNVNPAYLDQNNGVGPGSYSILNFFNYQTCCWHKIPEDHTPNDNGGYFLVVDGGTNPTFYSTRIDNLCPNTSYTFSAWAMNMDLPAYPSLPTFIFNVTDTLNNAIGQLSSLPMPVQTTATWVNNGFTFNSGANTSVKLSIILTSQGNNDFAFDDLALSVCGPTLSLTPAVNPCADKVAINATLGNGYSNPVYQWYKQNNGTWVSITNATTPLYVDTNPTQSNWYKLTVRDGISACSFIEDSVQVTVTTTPLANINIDSTICNTGSAYGHSQTGTYIIDTLKNINGCDSLQRSLNLTVNNCNTGGGSTCQGALVLHGNDEGLLPAPEMQYYASTGFTWECWFYSNWYNNTNNSNTYGQSLMMSEDAVVCEDINIGFGWHSYPRNAIGFNVDGPGGCGNSDGNPCYYTLPGGFQPNTWYHVAGVKDYANNTTKLYFNGQLVDTKVNTKIPFTRNITTRLGTEPVGGDSAFNGKMDEIRIWNYPRSATEISTYYNQCLTGNEAGLVTYYRANEASGSIAHDATPNHNDATLDPTVAWDKTLNAPLVNSCTHPTTSSIDTSICINQTYLGHTAPGTFIDTLLNVEGCDSIRTLNLTLATYKRDTVNQSICPGTNFSFNGTLYTQAGTYRDTLATATCDSITVLNLTVLPYKQDSIIQIICPGKSFLFNGTNYTTAGIYRDTLTTAGCDSIAILNLTVSTYKQDSITRTICAGKSFSFNGTTYSTTGIYRDTLTTAGCDSIAILNLIVLPYLKDSTSKSICEGTGFPFNGNTYTQAGVYRDTLISIAGCDSISIVNLTVKPKSFFAIDTSICEGQSYQGHTGSSNYTTTLTNANGCDSVVTVKLTVNANPVAKINTSSTKVNSGDIVQLNTVPLLSYLWTSAATINNPFIQNPTATINSSSWIYLQATDNTTDCHSVDSVFIVVNIDTTVTCNGSSIYVPNAFTPNSDGINDVFKIVAKKITLNRFQIFNRWGEMVFETTDINQGWDGFYKYAITPGNYVYWLSYYEPCDANAKMLKGNVILVK